MHTLSLPPFQVTLLYALVLVLPISDLINLFSVSSLLFHHGLPVDIQYSCLELKVWAFHKNDILMVLNAAKVLFVSCPMLCISWFFLWNYILSQIRWCQKSYWAKWNHHYYHAIAELTGCTHNCQYKNALLFRRMYCHFQIWKWKLSLTLWFLGHTWYSIILECLLAKWLVPCTWEWMGCIQALVGVRVLSYWSHSVSLHQVDKWVLANAWGYLFCLLAFLRGGDEVLLDTSFYVQTQTSHTCCSLCTWMFLLYLEDLVTYMGTWEIQFVSKIILESWHRWQGHVILCVKEHNIIYFRTLHWYKAN